MVERRPAHETPIRGKGFSLPELLAVMALLGIAIAIGIPLVNEQVRIAGVRAAADELALSLRAARRISVTKRLPVEFTIDANPAENSYTYKGNDGKERTVRIRNGVRIASSPAPPIVFKPNGSVDVEASIVLEADVSGARERWTATVNTMGFTTLVHERVN